MKRISKIYEEIREKDRIQIPVNVKMNKKYKKRIESLMSSINTYNNSKDTDTLKYSLTQSLRLIDEILEDNLKTEYDTKLSLKKKDYLIAKFKQYIKDKDDLDAELPDKDDDENPDIKLKDPANPTDAEIAKEAALENLLKSELLVGIGEVLPIQSISK